MILWKKMLFLSVAMLAFPLVIQAANMDEVGEKIEEAQQSRALEFSPRNLAKAKELRNKAIELLQQGDSAKAGQVMDEAIQYASRAIRTSRLISEEFSSLAESRDRLQLIGEEYVRSDLGERSESEFARFVEAVEDDNLPKAQREAEIASKTIQDAQVVAARERFSRPVSQAVAEARRHSARSYAPNALADALENHKQVEALIKADPNASGGAYKLSVAGVRAAQKSQSVGELGERLSKEPSTLEAWVDRERASLQKLADLYGVKLDNDDLTDAHVEALIQAAHDQQQGYVRQLSDAEIQLAEMDQRVKELSEKLGEYNSELADMQELRRKLQIKREAEAKIERLTKLFDPAKVEILLTTEADVILRMKKLNFRSGSAVIPPDTYDLLDRAVDALGTFADRSVRIEGHTDSVGESAFNQRLSERRATAVAAYIQERVAEGAQLNSVGFGEDKPVANNETAAGREQNRRIDIVLIAPK